MLLSSFKMLKQLKGREKRPLLKTLNRTHKESESGALKMRKITGLKKSGKTCSPSLFTHVMTPDHAAKRVRRSKKCHNQVWCGKTTTCNTWLTNKHWFWVLNRCWLENLRKEIDSWGFYMYLRIYGKWLRRCGRCKLFMIIWGVWSWINQLSTFNFPSSHPSRFFLLNSAHVYSQWITSFFSYKFTK